MKFLSWPWILFFILVAFAFAGRRPLGEPDEGRYAEAARELYLSGNWLVPRLQGQPHLTKPAFTYWATASGYVLLGVNEWGARVPLSLFFFLTILAVIELARTWGWSRNEALASGLIFATSSLPLIAGHLLTTDMFLTFWETLTMLGVWKIWTGDGRTSRWHWVFWLSLGFAFLTKGPPGWLPLLPILIFWLMTRKQQPRPGIWSTPAFLGFLVIAFSWYVLLTLKYPDILRYFLHDEVYGRIFTTMHRRAKPWWIYPFVIIGGMAPWFFLLPSLLGRAWANLRPSELPGEAGAPGCKRSTIVHRCWARLRSLDRPKLFSFLWFFIPLIVFTLVKSRLILYVLPLFAPLSIWCGRLLIRWFPAFWPIRPMLRRLAVICCVLWSAGFIVAMAFPDRLPQGKFYRDFSLELKRHMPPGAQVMYVMGEFNHSISFYTGLTIKKLDHAYTHKNQAGRYDKILPFLRDEQQQGRPSILFIKKNSLDDMQDAGYKVIAKKGKMVVIVATDPPPVPAR